MTKKDIQTLVSQSYTGRSLDEEKIIQIAQALSRSDLKKYIRILKQDQKKKTVYITVSMMPSVKQQSIIQSLYQDKTLVYSIDKSLLIGMKIQEYDIITEYDLKDNLLQLKNYTSTL